MTKQKSESNLKVIIDNFLLINLFVVIFFALSVEKILII